MWKRPTKTKSRVNCAVQNTRPGVSSGIWKCFTTLSPGRVIFMVKTPARVFLLELPACSAPLSSELRLGHVRYPREALSKTKIIVAVSKHLEVILTGIILIEDSCRYKLWCTASMVVSSSPSWKGFVLKSEPSLFLASLAIPRAVLGMWHDLPLILHGSRREGHSWRLATVVIYNDEIKELWP